MLVAISERRTSMETHAKAQQKRHVDPVTVDPKHYKVELENDQVRVLRINYGAHEKSEMHAHPAGVLVCLTDFHGKFTLPNGKAEERRGKAGETIWTPAEEHLPENLSDEPLEIVLVELKR
jgi:quercetin dioxygenase-like cupin family protein